MFLIKFYFKKTSYNYQLADFFFTVSPKLVLLPLLPVHDCLFFQYYDIKV